MRNLCALFLASLAACSVDLGDLSTRCKDDSHCATDSTCVDGKCELFACDACAEDEVCVANRCVVPPRCRAAADCGEGQVCSEGRCGCDLSAVGASCGAGTGACARQGTLRCVGLALSCDAIAAEPSPEQCDGVDNDCDGQTDEDLVPPPCPDQPGICIAAGPRSCNGAQGFGACPWVFGSLGSPDETQCDGLDNDCDGKVDEVVGCERVLAGGDSPDFRDGPGTDARFARPRGMTAGPEGELYVADELNHRVRRIASDGTVTTLAGTGTCGHTDGPVASATFCFPVDLEREPATGAIVVTERGRGSVRRIAQGAVSTLVLDTGRMMGGVGRATDGEVLVVSGDGLFTLDAGFRPLGFSGAFDVAGAADGTLVVSVPSRHQLVAFGPGADAGVIIGTGSEGMVDGAPAVAQLRSPSFLALRASGQSFLVSDTGNDAVRELSAGTLELLTLSGSEWNPGHRNGAASAARYHQVRGVAELGARLFVADANHAVRALAQGWLSDFAGGPAGAVDGPSRQARLAFASGLARGSDGSLYWAEKWRHQVRRLTPSGRVELVAGKPNAAAGSSDGLAQLDGGAVQGVAGLAAPSDVVVGPDGALYVADAWGPRIARVDLDAGRVTTIAGRLGFPGYVDSDDPARALFGEPVDLDLHAPADGGSPRLFVLDRENQAIRIVDLSTREVSTFVAVTDGGLLSSLSALAVTPSGELYVADGTTLRKLRTDGGVRGSWPMGTRITTLGADGEGVIVGTADGLVQLKPGQLPTPISFVGAGNRFDHERLAPSGVLALEHEVLHLDFEANRLRSLYR